MQVKILEEKLSTKDPETGRHLLLGKGDVVTVSNKAGEAWCRRGWAEDVDGIFPTGERSTRGVEVVPQKARHTSRSKTKGS